MQLTSGMGVICCCTTLASCAATYDGKYYMDFVENLIVFPAVKNFQNLLRIDKVITMSLVYYFLGHSVESVA